MSHFNILIYLAAGNSVNMEGAVPTEQEINQPKPSKRARTSFTADQLQVQLLLFFIHHIRKNKDKISRLCLGKKNELMYKKKKTNKR